MGPPDQQLELTMDLLAQYLDDEPAFDRARDIAQKHPNRHSDFPGIAKDMLRGFGLVEDELADVSQRLRGIWS